MFTNLLISLKRRISRPKNSFFSDISFEKVSLKRSNGCIMYFGKVKEKVRVSGFINSEGNGEELFIFTDNTIRRHKVKKYRTILDYDHFKGEYFTKSCLEGLKRVRILYK